MKRNLVIFLAFLFLGSSCENHSKKTSNNLKITKNREHIIDSYFLDTHLSDTAKYQHSSDKKLILANFKKIEQDPAYQCISDTFGLDSLINCFKVDSLRSSNGFDRITILQFQRSPHNFMPPITLYYILTKKRNEYISSFLLAESLDWPNHSLSCSSLIFNDSTILRKEYKNYVSDIEGDAGRSHSELTLFKYNNVTGCYSKRKNF
jgi:hypothetical protein